MVNCIFDKTNGGHLVFDDSLAYLENGYLASGSLDKTVKIWDVTNGKLMHTFDQSNGGHTAYVYSLAYLENGYLASGSEDASVKIWDITRLFQ